MVVAVTLTPTLVPHLSSICDSSDKVNTYVMDLVLLMNVCAYVIQDLVW